jgi:outer membrane receptor protein involved in Fe transport
MARYGADAGKDNFKVDSVFYVDAQVKYRFGENYEVYLGAKNLFDEDPPLLYAGLQVVAPITARTPESMTPSDGAGI